MKIRFKFNGLILLVFFLLLQMGYSQVPDLQVKSMKAKRSVQSIKIDAIIDDHDWIDGEAASNFIQYTPNPGYKSEQYSEVKISYDNNALYISAQLIDDEADQILKELSIRDNMGNTDWFGVIINPYNDGINAIGFFVTASGVQV